MAKNAIIRQKVAITPPQPAASKQVRSAQAAASPEPIRKVRLGEVCYVSAGQGAPQGNDSYSDNGTPFIKAGDLYRLVQDGDEASTLKVSEDIVKKYRLKLFQKGAVLFAKSGMSCMQGHVYVLKQNCYVVSHLAVITPKDEVSSEYIHHHFAFHSPNSLVKDPAYPSISLGDIASIKLDIPPLATQRAIAEELDRICELKRTAEKLVEKYRQLIKAKFSEMFGDVAKYKTVKVGDAFRVCGPKRVFQSEWTHSGIPFLKVSDIVERIEGKEWSASCFISEEHYLRLKANGQVPVEGDVLVTARGTIGRCYLVHADDAFYFQDGMISWLSRRIGEIDAAYFLKVAETDDFKRQYEGKSSGSTVAYLSIKQLSELSFPLPPLPLQREFAAFVEKVEKLEAAAKATVEKYDLLYRSKLQEYFG